MKKKITPDDIKKMQSVRIEEGSADYIDEFGNAHNIDDDIEQAEKEIEKIQSASVHFRWSKAEIERCKKIAEKKGLKYQTYIKSVLKQAMDKDDVA